MSSLQETPTYAYTVQRNIHEGLKRLFGFRKKVGDELYFLSITIPFPFVGPAVLHYALCNVPVLLFA